MSPFSTNDEILEAIRMENQIWERLQGFGNRRQMRKFALFCVVGGGICLADSGLQAHGSPDPLSGLGWLCLILALLAPLIRFAVRRLRVCELTDDAMGI